jgi:hypothetical protein
MSNKTARKSRKNRSKTAKKSTTARCPTGTHRENGKCRTQKPKCKAGYHRPAPTKRCQKN